AVSPTAQPLHFKAGLSCMIHEHAHLFACDDNFRVEPGIAVGRWVDWLLVLARLFRSELLPGPFRMSNILDRVAGIIGIVSTEIERTEIDAFELFIILAMKCDA